MVGIKLQCASGDSSRVDSACLVTGFTASECPQEQKRLEVMGEPSTALIRESQNSSIPGETPTCGCSRSHAKLRQENCSCAHAVAGDTAKQDGTAAIRVACANRLRSLHGTFLSQRSVGRAAHPAGEEGGYKVSREY